MDYHFNQIPAGRWWGETGRIQATLLYVCYGARENENEREYREREGAHSIYTGEREREGVKGEREGAHSIFTGYKYIFPLLDAAVRSRVGRDVNA